MGCNYSQVEKEASSGVRLCCQEVLLVYFQPTAYVTHRLQAIANPF